MLRSFAPKVRPLRRILRGGRRRENMVGVNMVLAEFVKFKHGLYKSCVTDCLEGIMLEPYLLQPCVHIAGEGAAATAAPDIAALQAVYIYIYIYV